MTYSQNKKYEAQQRISLAYSVRKYYELKKKCVVKHFVCVCVYFVGFVQYEPLLYMVQLVFIDAMHIVRDSHDEHKRAADFVVYAFSLVLLFRSIEVCKPQHPFRMPAASTHIWLTLTSVGKDLNHNPTIFRIGCFKHFTRSLSCFLFVCGSNWSVGYAICHRNTRRPTNQTKRSRWQEQLLYHIQYDAVHVLRIDVFRQ